MPRSRLSHLDKSSKARMVDVGHKRITRRTALAEGFIRIQRSTLRAIAEDKIAKGEVLSVARLAGILAAKRTAELIPLCHPLPLTHVDVTTRLRHNGVEIEARASTSAQTGVEMEALTAVAVAALTIYDMCKAIDKTMTIGDVRLLRKTK